MVLGFLNYKNSPRRSSSQLAGRLKGGIPKQLSDEYTLKTMNQNEKITMPKVNVDLPTTVFSALRKEPKDFVNERRLAAAVKWYEIGEISQEKAAEIAGLTRS